MKMPALMVTLLLAQAPLAAHAVTIEPKGKALAAILGSTKVSQKKFKIDGADTNVFYAKDAAGKASRLAFVQEGLYPPNCTHTWVVGVDPGTAAVTEVRVVEMECPHAFPTKEVSFLAQFVGKAPADLESLSEVKAVAKATGSSELAIGAVKKSIRAGQQIRGQL
ncbi:MAG: hypothetical protein EOP11_10110 [Proteobacteria bacterium]|nr:MAG: hypothetical protein EOP11_10110 [Pseudomonadota bacterium]